MNFEVISGTIECKLKTVIYGPEGIGKTTFASKFPDPLFIDTEGSTKHLNVKRLPDPKSWQMLLQEIQHVRDTPNICKTLIIDTADWAERLCIMDVCTRKGWSGIEDPGYGKGFTYLAEEFEKLLKSLDEVIQKGIHVVLTAHATMRKFEQPDEMGAYDRWELKLQKKTAPMLKEWADIVLFANYKTMAVKTSNGSVKAQGGKRVMYTTHHACWDAKNRFNLPEETDFNYEAISSCFELQSSGKATVAEEEMYFYHPESESLFSVAKGQPLPNDGLLQEISKERYEELKKGKVKKSKPLDINDNAEPQVHTIENTASEHDGDWDGIPDSLLKLMKENDVKPYEIQNVVAGKHYYPQITPIKHYKPDFIEEVLLAAWDQVFETIKNERDLPF